MKIASLSLGKTEKPESERFAPFMTFLKFVIPGFKEAYDQKMAQQNYDAKMKAQYRIRVPLQEAPKSIFNQPYTTENNKPKKQLISKKQFGGKNEYKFRRGSQNLNNGYGVIYDQIMQTTQNGQPTYDAPPVVAGRTIYQTPKGNDTIFYRNNPDIFNHTPKGDPNQQRAKNYFYKMIRKAPSEGQEYKGTKYWNNQFQSTYNARNRALKGYQYGGELPTAPKAEVRYANSRRIYPDNLMFKYNQTYLNGTTRGVIQNTPYTTIPAYITQQVIGNDTIYRETPDQKRFRLRGFPITRQASSTDQDRNNYDKMKNRFYTAWGIAK